MISSLQLRYVIRLKSTLFLCFCLLFCFIANTQKKEYVVVLDPGHGGYDPGKVGYKGLKEKDIVLKIAKLVGNKLSKQPSIKVIYTRNKDIAVNLWQRGKIANKVNADLFVSIHCNAHKSEVSGSETWVLGLHANKQNFEVAKRENAVILKEDNYKEAYKGFDPNSPESVIGLTVMQEENLDKSLWLASSIENSFKQQLKRKSRGVKQAGFIVLHQTYMPSVLIETGFLTNKQEAMYLNSAKGQTQIANSIAKAIKEYVDNLKKNTVVAAPTPNKEDKQKNVEQQFNSSIVFKVQIASSKKRIRTKAYNFKGLKNVERVKVGNYFKYYYGITNSYKETEKALKLAKDKGYNSAFIAAFKDGKKISVKHALSSSLSKVK